SRRAAFTPAAPAPMSPSPTTRPTPAVRRTAASSSACCRTSGGYIRGSQGSSWFPRTKSNQRNAEQSCSAFRLLWRGPRWGAGPLVPVGPGLGAALRPDDDLDPAVVRAPFGRAVVRHGAARAEPASGDLLGRNPPAHEVRAHRLGAPETQRLVRLRIAARVRVSLDDDGLEALVHHRLRHLVELLSRNRQQLVLPGGEEDRAGERDDHAARLLLALRDLGEARHGRRRALLGFGTRLALRFERGAVRFRGPALRLELLLSLREGLDLGLAEGLVGLLALALGLDEAGLRFGE